MSYQTLNHLGLQARDYVFFYRYLIDRIFGKTKTKSLVFCNSYPKSGTHLLYQILYSLPELKIWDDIVSVRALSGIMNAPAHIRWKIGSAPDSSIIRSHLMCCDEIKEILQEFDCKIIFIYRDLRDVAVSQARWVTKEEKMFLHQYYSSLDSFEERLMCSIRGVPLGTPFGSNFSLPNIGQDFARWCGWIDDPDCLAVKFEDLVGARGGGSETTRLKTVEKIIDYLDIDLSTSEIASQFSSEAMNPEESHTFRKGGKGSIKNWQSVFQEAHKEEFKKVAGNLLIELGYESDLNW